MIATAHSTAVPSSVSRPPASASGLGDADLAHALLRGDPGAPRRAWNRYVAPVRKVIRSVLGYDPDVEDVVQEVFLRLFSRLGTLQHPESFRSFVISVAVRIGKHARRGRHRRRWLRLTETGHVPDDEILTVGIETRVELRRLCRLLDRIPHRERQVLLLRHLKGMTLREIAKAMRLSLATIKRAVKHGSLRLADLNNRESGEQTRWRRIARPRRIVPTLAGPETKCPPVHSGWRRHAPARVSRTDIQTHQAWNA